LIDANVDKKKVLIGSRFNSAKSEYLISLLDNAKIGKFFSKKQLSGLKNMSTYRKQLNQFFAKTFKGSYIEVAVPKSFDL